MDVSYMPRPKSRMLWAPGMLHSFALLTVMKAGRIEKSWL
jgi:hypothetical protein